MGNDLSRFYRSFSGTDSLAFIILPNAAPVLLGSLTTVSYSMFRDKKPVPLIGKINVGGFTRGTRIYAGTMIFTVINQHWINDLLDQVPWLKSYGKIKADELPIFDIMVICANEYGASVQMFIYGVDITDEGQVLSVEDMFTEDQFSFVARDLDTFSNDAVPKTDFSGSNTIIKVNDFDFQYNDPEIFVSNRIPLDRNISYDNSNMMTGDDILQIQHYLNNAGIPTNMTGIYDPMTFDSVKKFQASVRLPITGNITDDTYNALIGNKNEDTDTIGVVVSKGGAVVYLNPDSSSPIINKLNYKDTIKIIGDSNEWYKTEKGYISKSHVFSNTSDPNIEFATLRLGSRGKEVVMLQEGLNFVVNKNIPVTGVFDEDTLTLVLKFEELMGLAVDGVIDKNDWIVLQEKYNGNVTEDVKSDNYAIEFVSIPKTATYKLSNFKYENEGIICKDIVGDSTVKVSAVAYYPNDKSKTFTTSVQLKSGQDNTPINPMIVQDAFLYNGLYKSLPEEVDFITLPFGNEPMKWSYKFS